MAVIADINELGVAGARRLVLQDGVLGCRPVRLVQQRVAGAGLDSGKSEGVLGVLPAHSRAVLKPFQGHLFDCLRRTRRYPCGPFMFHVPQEVEYDLGVHRMGPRPVGAVLQWEGGSHPFPVGYRA